MRSRLWNYVSSVGAFIAGFGVLVFLATMIEAFIRKRHAADNPWGIGCHDAGVDAVLAAAVPHL